MKTLNSINNDRMMESNAMIGQNTWLAVLYNIFKIVNHDCDIKDPDIVF